VKAKGEIISTIMSLHDETVFARSTNVHRSKFETIPNFEQVHDGKQTTSAAN
jgi:hypothetical protein